MPLIAMTEEEMAEETRRMYIPVTLDGEVVGCLPQPDFPSKYYLYGIKPVKRVNFLGAKYDVKTSLPCELVLCDALKMAKKIPGFSGATKIRVDGDFIVYLTDFGTMGVKRDFGVPAGEASDDIDGALVPLPERHALERVIPPLPLTAYRAMIEPKHDMIWVV